MKVAGKKVLWLKEREEVLELRGRLRLRSDGITMLMLATMGMSQKLDHAAQTLRIEAVHRILKKTLRAAEEQKIQLEVMDRKLEEQAQTSVALLSNVRSGINMLTSVDDIVFEIRNILVSFQKLTILNQCPKPGIGTCWRQAPVTLEDAFGNVVPLPLELVDSWDMLEAILAKRFERAPGHTKVLNGEYAIEDSITGNDFEKNREWIMCFRPGQKVDMSMVFADTTKSRTTCPRCTAVVDGANNVKIQCTKTGCGMWFRRIEEITKENVPAPGQHEPVGPSTRYEDLRRILFQKAVAGNENRR